MSVTQLTVSGSTVYDIAGVRVLVSKQATVKKTIWCLLPSCNESVEHYFTTDAELAAHTSEHHPGVSQGKQCVKEKKKHHKASTKFYRANRLAGKTWSCGVCEKVFNKYSKNNKRNHLETHLPECERTYKCQHQTCSRRFPQKSAADAHFHNVHHGNSHQPIRNSQKGGYKKREPTVEDAEKARCELKKL